MRRWRLVRSIPITPEIEKNIRLRGADGKMVPRSAMKLLALDTNARNRRNRHNLRLRPRFAIAKPFTFVSVVIQLYSIADFPPLEFEMNPQPVTVLLGNVLEIPLEITLE